MRKKSDHYNGDPDEWGLTEHIHLVIDALKEKAEAMGLKGD